MKKYILALDQGTTSSRAVLFDHDTNIIGIEQRETKQIYPQPGWVEQDAEEIWMNQLLVIKDLLAKTGISGSEIIATGITNQRETTIIWDRNTGKPVYNAIIWQDKRTAGNCEDLKRSGFEQEIKETTGLVIDSYFSATKIAWILDHVPGLRKKAEQGDLLFGTVDTWLAWQLSGGRLHITDASNASRTLLFNIATGEWDAKMLEIFNVPECILPKVCNSSEVYGTTAPELFGGIEIPIAGIAGDQQAALFGQSCFKPGMAKNTYGTGCFMLMNTGEKRIVSDSGLLTTVAWSLGGKMEYALEGSVFIAGAVVKWLHDSLKIIKTAAETEFQAEEAGSNNGVYFVPAFTGLGAPYWDMEARGIISGLTQGVDSRHIVRAALESMAYQTRDILGAMEKDSGISLRSLNVDGGACVNNFLMQFQSDILGVEVVRPAVIETTAMGAAFLAGIASGFWKKDELPEKRKIDKVFSPQMSAGEREKLYAGWLKAVGCARK